VSNQTDGEFPLPSAYLVSLTTHQMVYQEVTVESEKPLLEREVIQKALEHAEGKWEPGPIDENPDVDSIQILRRKSTL